MTMGILPGTSAPSRPVAGKEVTLFGNAYILGLTFAAGIGGLLFGYDTVQVWIPFEKSILEVGFRFKVSEDPLLGVTISNSSKVIARSSGFLTISIVVPDPADSAVSETGTRVESVLVDPISVPSNT